MSVFWAAQANQGDRGFLSKEITVRDMLIHHGDVHHIFPRNYLKKQGLPRGRYNQLGNFVYLQQEVNIKIGDKAPEDYLSQVLAQCEKNEPHYGAISNLDDLKMNFAENCLPMDMDLYKFERYDDFLDVRRRLMAEKIKNYYQSL